MGEGRGAPGLAPETPLDEDLERAVGVAELLGEDVGGLSVKLVQIELLGKVGDELGLLGGVDLLENEGRLDR